jgi:hypothetical protein
MKRPVAVTVFGVLNIVFAGFGLVGMLGTFVLLFADPALAAGNPALKAIQDNPGYAAWIKLSIPLGLLTCAVLLAAGIGLLMLKRWGRNLSIAYGVYAIVMALANMGVSYNYLVRPLMDDAARKHGPEAAAAIGGAVGGIAGGCLGLIYPVLLLIFMTRPTVKAAFRSSTDSAELPPAW